LIHAKDRELLKLLLSPLLGPPKEKLSNPSEVVIGINPLSSSSDGNIESKADEVVNEHDGIDDSKMTIGESIFENEPRLKHSWFLSGQSTDHGFTDDVIQAMAVYIREKVFRFEENTMFLYKEISKVGLVSPSTHTQSLSLIMV
jgi:hypothetical protein